MARRWKNSPYATNREAQRALKDYRAGKPTEPEHGDLGVAHALQHHHRITSALDQMEQEQKRRAQQAHLEREWARTRTS